MRHKIWKRLALVFGGLLIFAHWLTAISAIKKGQIFAYQNYWGAPQEARTLLFLLMIGTPAYIALIWKHWR